MKKIFTIPNIITLARILGTVALIFIPKFGVAFFIVYSFCGVTDALDGFVARVTKQTSKLGSVLDSAADLFFYLTMLYIIFPVLWERLPFWVWIFTGAVFAVRGASYITAAVKFKKFSAMHTYLNKASTLVLFLVPYFYLTDFFVGYCIGVCAVGFLSSVEELIIHLTEKKYNNKRKTIFKKSNMA